MKHLDTSRPFLRKAGVAAGLTKHQLDSPRFHRLFGSVRMARSTELTPQVLARAALLVAPGAVVSDQTAARIWGGIVPEDPRTHLTVATPADRRVREGLHCHVRTDVETRQKRDLLVTSPAQTFVDLAAELDLVDLVVLGDSMVRAGSVTVDELVEAAGRATHCERLARHAAALVREGAESPMETRVRLLVIFAGLPEPQVQWWVGDGRYRLDLAWPELRLAVEYDGRHHAEDARQWGHDLSRREWFDANGWRIIVLRSTDVYDTPWQTITRIVAAMAERGYDKPLDVAPALVREHFPGRPWRRAAG